MDNITRCLQYLPWYLAEVRSICLRQILCAEAKCQEKYCKHQVVLYLLCN